MAISEKDILGVQEYVNRGPYILWPILKVLQGKKLLLQKSIWQIVRQQPDGRRLQEKKLFS